MTRSFLLRCLHDYFLQLFKNLPAYAPICIVFTWYMLGSFSSWTWCILFKLRTFVSNVNCGFNSVFLALFSFWDCVHFLIHILNVIKIIFIYNFYHTCAGIQIIQTYKLLLGLLVAKSWLTLCDPMDCSLLGSSVHGIS